MQFDLQSGKIIREIWTQGRDDPDGLYKEWVRSFRMSYSNSGVSWISYGYWQSTQQAQVCVRLLFYSDCHEVGVAPESRNYGWCYLTQKRVIHSMNHFALIPNNEVCQSTLIEILFNGPISVIAWTITIFCIEVMKIVLKCVLRPFLPPANEVGAR